MVRSFLIPYIKQSGISHTIKKIFSQFTLRTICDDYLIIKGIHHGRRAFKGPLSVQIDLTDECNNSCMSCWSNSPLIKNTAPQKHKKYYLDYPKTLEIIDELKVLGTKEITLSGGGEPFMHPHLFNILEYIKKKNISCQLYTNFTLAGRDSIKKLVDLDLNQLVVSIGAATPQTYCLVHPDREESVFYALRDKLLFLRELKTARKKPWVRIHNVIHSLNCHEITEMVDFAYQMQVDAVSFAAIDSMPGSTDTLLLSQEQRRAALIECSKSNHKIPIYDMEGFRRRISSDGALRGEYEGDGVDSMPCYVGWLFARITADGNVNPCLKSHRIPTGNIYRQNFKTIWNSLLQQEFRKETNRLKKNTYYFTAVGNDFCSKSGCRRVCDDFTRNIVMHRKITLFPTSRFIKLIVNSEEKIYILQKRFLRLIKILYLILAVILYSLMLKIYRSVKKIVIFPGE